MHHRPRGRYKVRLPDVMALFFFSDDPANEFCQFLITRAALHLGMHTSRAHKQRATVFGRRDSLAVPIEQAHAERMLQFRDRPRNVGLGGVETLAGATGSAKSNNINVLPLNLIGDFAGGSMFVVSGILAAPRSSKPRKPPAMT